MTDIKGYVVRGTDDEGTRAAAFVWWDGHDEMDTISSDQHTTFASFADADRARGMMWIRSCTDLRIFAVAADGTETPLPTYEEALTELARLKAPRGAEVTEEDLTKLEHLDKEPPWIRDSAQDGEDLPDGTGYRGDDYLTTTIIAAAEGDDDHVADCRNGHLADTIVHLRTVGPKLARALRAAHVHRADVEGHVRGLRAAFEHVREFLPEAVYIGLSAVILGLEKVVRRTPGEEALPPLWIVSVGQPARLATPEEEALARANGGVLPAERPACSPTSEEEALRHAIETITKEEGDDPAEHLYDAARDQPLATVDRAAVEQAVAAHRERVGALRAAWVAYQHGHRSRPASAPETAAWKALAIGRLGLLVSAPHHEARALAARQVTAAVQALAALGIPYRDTLGEAGMLAELEPAPLTEVEALRWVDMRLNLGAAQQRIATSMLLAANRGEIPTEVRTSTREEALAHLRVHPLFRIYTNMTLVRMLNSPQSTIEDLERNGVSGEGANPAEVASAIAILRAHAASSTVPRPA